MPDTKLKSTEECYELACRLRHRADVWGDAELYEKAAALFEEIQFTEAAKHCRERAQHYRDRSA